MNLRSGWRTLVYSSAIRGLKAAFIATAYRDNHSIASGQVLGEGGAHRRTAAAAGAHRWFRVLVFWPTFRVSLTLDRPTVQIRRT
jgi:hypothetical protein